MRILQNAVPVSIRILGTSCYLLHVPFSGYQHLALFDQLILSKNSAQSKTTPFYGIWELLGALEIKTKLSYYTWGNGGPQRVNHLIYLL